MSKSSEEGLDASFTKAHIAMSQANQALTESLNMRRALDNKIYGLIALTATLLALLLTLRPWVSRGSFSIAFQIVAFGMYLIVIALGMREYSPTDVHLNDARGFFDMLDRRTEKLVRWNTRYLLDCTDWNYSKVNEKAAGLNAMIWLFLTATILLAIGALLN